MGDRVSTVYLLRHGRTAFNREGIFRGRMDVPLDAVGRLQAAAAGDLLRPAELAAVYSSPLSRAVDTARELARGRGLEPRVEERFNNLELGPWTGRPRTDVAAEDPANWEIWLTCPEKLDLPGAETLGQVADRSARCLGELVERHRGAAFAVVSHRAVLKPLLARILGLAAPWFWRLAVDPASVSVVTHAPSRGYTLVSLNQTHHLHLTAGNPDDA